MDGGPSLTQLCRRRRRVFQSLLKESPCRRVVCGSHVKDTVYSVSL